MQIVFSLWGLLQDNARGAMSSLEQLREQAQALQLQIAAMEAAAPATAAAAAAAATPVATQPQVAPAAGAAQQQVAQSQDSQPWRPAFEFLGTRTQDYQALANYWTTSHWRVTSSSLPRAMRLQLFVETASKLGCSNASEKTAQLIAACFFLACRDDPTMHDINAVERHAYLKMIKEDLEKPFKKCLKRQVLVALPEGPQELRDHASTRALYDAAYKTECPVHCPFSAGDIKTMCDSIPLRLNPRVVASPMSRFSGATQSNLSCTAAASALLQALTGATNEELPGLQIFGRRASRQDVGQARSPGLLALADASPPDKNVGLDVAADAVSGATAAAAAPPAGSAESGSSPSLTPADAAERLLGKMSELKGQEDKKGKEKEDKKRKEKEDKKGKEATTGAPMKRPAAATSQEDVSKRPRMPTGNAKVGYLQGSITAKMERQCFRVSLPAPFHLDVQRSPRDNNSD